MGTLETRFPRYFIPLGRYNEQGRKSPQRKTLCDLIIVSGAYVLQ